MSEQERRAPARQHRLAQLMAGVMVAAAAASCGGGGGGAALPPAPAPVPTPPPNVAGGLFVGHYAEDAANNPEDPTLGVLHLTLPSASAPFSGQMFFTYVGCQTQNVGLISGERSANALTGAWSGDVDGEPQSGSYAGEFDAALGGFAGTYTVDKGKQPRDLEPCISYIIAANGSWELLPVEASVPTGFSAAVGGTTVQWVNPAGTALTLVAVIDEAQALAGQAGATVLQQLGDPSRQSFDLAGVAGLVPGNRYVVTVAAADAQARRLAATSVVVVR